MSSTFDIFHMLEDTCINTQKPMNTDININDWVLVNCFREFFPGKITDLKGDKACVSCLQKAGIYFKYPITTDMNWYPASDIITTLHEPELKNTRGFYSHLIKKKMK